MFELASTGHSFGEIARYLNEHGSRARNGNEWATSTITQVIRNPFYIGEIHLKDEV
ncbi:recombinase family protein, partial [bacterium]|nr:recombinase family protein [bacterium]